VVLVWSAALLCSAAFVSPLLRPVSRRSRPPKNTPTARRSKAPPHSTPEAKQTPGQNPRPSSHMRHSGYSRLGLVGERAVLGNAGREPARRFDPAPTARAGSQGCDSLCQEALPRGAPFRGHDTRSGIAWHRLLRVWPGKVSWPRLVATTLRLGTAQPGGRGAVTGGRGHCC
jgi:hypothetical protein